MDLRDEIQEWIEWSRQNLPAEGHIPKINAEQLEPLFQGKDTLSMVFDYLTPGDHPSEREKLLAQFLDALSADPLDIPSRYTALVFYHALQRCWSLYGEEHVLPTRDSLGEDLRSLIGLVSVQNCPPIGGAYAGRSLTRMQ